MRAASRAPNVVLIVAPGWRGVATPWAANAQAGDPDLRAPNLTKFAQEAVVFPRAYACDPAAAPARSGILTGRYPHDTLGQPVPLGAALKSEGYRIMNDPTALDKTGDPPFFLHVALSAPPSAKPADPAKMHLRENVPAGREEETRIELAQRYGIYASLDEQLGSLLAKLAALGHGENTIVVFISDRGEQIGSHGLDGDGAPFEESVRIALAIRFPRALHPDASDILVSQVDILPTILGLCGASPLDDVQGRDLSPLLTGANGDRPESLFVEGNLRQKDEWRMILLGTDKLVVDADGSVTKLYNLASDPYELTNLAHDPAAELKRDTLLANLRAARSRLLDFRRRS